MARPTTALSEPAHRELCTNYIKVSTAAGILERDAATVYRLFDQGRIRGIVVDGIKLIQLSGLREFIDGPEWERLQRAKFQKNAL